MQFKSLLNSLPISLCLFAMSTLAANEGNRVVVDDTSEFINQQDIQALRDWISTKRQVTVKQVGGDLSISGEVRMEMQHSQETKNGVKQRGTDSVSGKPANEYDIEVNLMLDYRVDTTNWASVKIEFDNSAGSDNNVFNKLTIERAILGMRVIDGDTTTVDLEGGRRYLSSVYDSKVQFSSFLDGFTVRYDKATERFGDFYARFSPFLVNETRYQWALVGELGLLRIYNTGLYAKYSIVDWNTKSFAENETLANLYRFVNSQWTLGYQFVPKWFDKMITLYSAFLINTEAKGVHQTNYDQANKAWYAGFSIGKVRNKGDWSLDVNYQYVQAQAVPIFDAQGIGRGNADRVGFYTLNSDGTGEVTAVETAVGKTNYKGISVTLLYLLTDTITIYQSYQHAVNANWNIGPNMHYNQYEIEFIYAF